MTTPTAQSIFGTFSTLKDVAALLESSAEQLQYLLYGRREDQRYTTFQIPKRRGGSRVIQTPKADLKSIQRRLANFLQDNVQTRPAAHGFVRLRSIVTNAEKHVRHRLVFNVDLKDFFPTIHFGRVRGLFMKAPFGASSAVATILAQICCHEGRLPQGAATSPIISNLICSRLDAQLTRLARDHKCVYTRYVDDLTFSKRKGTLPNEIAVEDETGTYVIGQSLREIIQSNGFVAHPEKIHLYRNSDRQYVTGLVVNSRINVPRRFIRELRAIICDWRKNGLEAAQHRHHQNFHRGSRSNRSAPPLNRIVDGKLNFLKMIRGLDDPVRRNLQRQFVNVWPDYQATMEKENNQLDMRDLFISHASEDKPGLVRPLVQALITEGVSVWYDEFELTIGDDLISKVNEGLNKSRYGVVILSPDFFKVKKTWPNREVSGLFALEDADNRPRVLPIWHNVDQPAVAAKNPILAGKVAWKSSDFTPVELAMKFRDFMKTRRTP